MVLILESRSHLDLGDLPNLLAAELGVMTVRLERAIRSLDEVAQVHVNRWGDGSAHLHLWFLGRPAGRLQLRGPFLAMWDEILEPVSEPEWRVNLAHIAAWLEEFGGRALIEPPRIEWHAPSTFASVAAMQAPAPAAGPTAAAASDGDGHAEAEQERAAPANTNTSHATDGSATAGTPESGDTVDGAVAPVVAAGAPAQAPTSASTATANAGGGQAPAGPAASGETETGAASTQTANAGSAAASDNAAEDGDEIADGDVAGAGAPTVRIPAQPNRARVGRAPSGRFVATRDPAERVADDDPDYDLASDSR
ncbi:MAG TPA: hypothetical protein VFR11_16365 [Micromonosporaceae bacterium]|nr:hypothetical protein [Micromonosporaceae bacterium]